MTMVTMGCHTALQNPDVVREILQQLSPLDNNCSYDRLREIRMGLAACARVCRMFSEPALDFLWWKLGDITPALRLLPSIRVDEDNQTTSRISEYSVKYYLTGVPSIQEWAHFQEYARRVRVIDYYRAYFGLPAILSQLSDQNDRRPLFPLLQRISWNLSLTEDNPSIVALVSPTLRQLSVDLHGYDWTTPVAAMASRACSVVLQAVPDLRILQLDTSCHGLMLPVRFCRNLRELHSYHGLLRLDPNFWQDLFRLEHLSEVQGGFELPENVPDDGFVAIQSLSLEIMDVVHAIRFLKVVPPQQLRHTSLPPYEDLPTSSSRR
ncbi:uncharacterized protein LAESUDRAFT_241018 [Laetiporus sulphureus 93-53]|uniref:F-box domain-containing protein n=1 Tax=Laetiporus sulphureus 93-53 TaxID=1314785 RepID=A0A165DKG3_9APHY|nr:uncharacterized protein LAESUDRAFT_241018 [Laetiporus sulphureus 93-53]KZT05078.1 hypothetical protein LAESUDRAFT_241018 [Laetiporus sulphureus 93-53]